MKILVTGNAGSGKSTFGKIISEKLNIPLYGLDKIVWGEGWKVVPRSQRESEIEEITLNNSWIIEGVSKQAFNKAERVIFLDISPRKCVLNILLRFLKNGLSTREGLPKNCAEYIGVFKAIKLAISFNKLTRPWIINESKNKKVLVIKKYDELIRALEFVNIERV